MPGYTTMPYTWTTDDQKLVIVKLTPFQLEKLSKFKSVRLGWSSGSNRSIYVPADLAARINKAKKDGKSIILSLTPAQILGNGLAAR